MFDLIYNVFNRLVDIDDKETNKALEELSELHFDDCLVMSGNCAYLNLIYCYSFFTPQIRSWTS